MTATLRTATLGCKVNQYETQLVREGLLGLGYADAAPDQAADVCVVNTCTVTSEGDAKSRQVIRRMHRQNPAARIIVMGCYATRCPDEVSRLPGVADVVTDKRELGDLLGRFGVVDLPTGISGLGQRQRAYVKVQDGCLLRCTYCIIPAVRPQMYSREPQEILDEVRRLVDNGYREVVLTGIHLGHYGVDFNSGRPREQWTRLAGLLPQLASIPGDFRLRLSSIEATEVTNDLIAVMREFDRRICPHLHVCLQSGSDRVLSRMRRRWGARRIIDRCLKLREILDQPALTSDVIVGFPGESEADFADTVAACREIGFSKIHIFPFSPRRGTPAATMPDQVAPGVKQQRMKHLADVENQLRSEYFASLIGRQLDVLVEKLDQHRHAVQGTACRYAPTTVRWDNSTPLPALGDIIRVHIQDQTNSGLAGSRWQRL